MNSQSSTLKLAKFLPEEKQNGFFPVVNALKVVKEKEKDKDKGKIIKKRSRSQYLKNSQHLELKQIKPSNEPILIVEEKNTRQQTCEIFDIKTTGIQKMTNDAFLDISTRANFPVYGEKVILKKKMFLNVLSKFIEDKEDLKKEIKCLKSILNEKIINKFNNQCLDKIFTQFEFDSSEQKEYCIDPEIRRKDADELMGSFLSILGCMTKKMKKLKQTITSLTKKNHEQAKKNLPLREQLQKKMVIITKKQEQEMSYLKKIQSLKQQKSQIEAKMNYFQNEWNEQFSFEGCDLQNQNAEKYLKKHQSRLFEQLDDLIKKRIFSKENKQFFIHMIKKIKNEYGIIVKNYQVIVLKLRKDIEIYEKEVEGYEKIEKYRINKIQKIRINLEKLKQIENRLLKSLKQRSEKSEEIFILAEPVRYIFKELTSQLEQIIRFIELSST